MFDWAKKINTAKLKKAMLHTVLIYKLFEHYLENDTSFEVKIPIN